MGVWTPGPGATTGDDTFTGDGTNETVSGLAGADILHGAGGNDTLIGGVGADTLDGGDGADIASYAGASVGVNASLETPATNTGDAAGDTYTGIEGLTGSGQADTLTGDGGANILDGSAGADTLNGGAGDDMLDGGSENDTLIGGDGADRLDGEGGADNMSGGIGDDVYLVDGVGDIVTEALGAGNDRVASSISYTLGANVEQLTLLGLGDINAFGNELDNAIVGNDGANIINGLLGADTMTGAKGDDTYVVDNVGDVVIENSSTTHGVDLVYAGVSYVLPVGVENLVLTGNGNINATGNSLINGITGNGSANILDGGAGADNMQGGDGDDTYIVDNALDTTTENAGQGTDTVQSSVTRTLGANIENLTLTGSGNIDGTGNTENNVINGNTGANTLSGLEGNDTINGGDGADIIIGGLGVDTLSGGEGNDGFSYTIGDGNGAVDGGNGTDSFVISDVAGANTILSATMTGSVITNIVGNTLTSVESVFANMGDGIDWLVYNTSSDVVVNFTTTAATGFSGVSNVERVVGGSGNDTLTGDGNDNRLDGSSGGDTLAGLGGVDTLIGGDGDDWLTGGLGNDSVQGGAGNDNIGWTAGDGRDTIDGGADFDTFSISGTAGVELGQATWNGTSITALMDSGLSNIEAINLNLGGGIDWLIYNTTFAVTVNLATGSASGFASVANIEKVIGNSGNDTLTGDALDNRLDGQGGADTLDGGSGSDTVLGGDGNDTIYASAGNDSLQGQNGADTFIWTSADGRDTFNGGADIDTVNLTGSAVADVADANWNGTTITGLLNNALIDIENVNIDLGASGSGGDWLRYNTTLGVTVNLAAGTGTGFASITGVENLIGGTGNDSLTGDGVANKINGNTGDDIITGGGGNDSLTGGLGSDTFVYAAGCGNDSVTDFDAWAVGGQDFIDVSAFGINASNFATRIAIIDTGTDTVIRIDGTYFINLQNVTGDGDNVITQDDFIFGP